ncbi:MAG TPA: glycosyltransferase [Ktedonobacteraceae bacterium]|nr:glycosyltransferase [Ktedonobacteraceae bacterium]
MPALNEQTPIKKPFRVLTVTGAYPTKERPYAGTFCKSQVDSLIAAGLEMDVLLPPPGPSPLRYANAAVQVFLKSLTGRYDVIHGHYGLWCLVSRLQWTTPVVAAYWGDDVLGTVQADGSYSSKSSFVAAISRKLCYWVDAVIVKSEQMKKAAGGPQERIFVIPNGVNFEHFHPIPRSEARTALGWDQDRYYVLFANNPDIPVKNFALAQAAVEKVRKKGVDVELIVARSVPHAQMVQYMNASNALILPSIAEGSPNVVKEAMACNVPVVATNVGDVAEVIGRTEGCSVCPHDAEELAAGLERAFAHKGPTTGRQDIQHLNSTFVAKQVIAVYELVTHKKVAVVERTQTTTKEEVYAKEK